MGQALGRLFAVLTGFVLAVLAGGLTLLFAGSRWAAQEVAANMPDDTDAASQFINQALGMVAFVFTVAPALTLAPAIIAVVVGEIARIRSVLYYVVAGGAAAALMPLIAVHGEAAQTTTYNTAYFTIMATSGFAAGLIYWLLAGRRA
jgi:hypothetical protein